MKSPAQQLAALSVKVRFGGKTDEEISAIMKAVRAARKPKKKAKK